MLVTLQLLGALAATLFAGAALYINVAEHPARMTLDPRTAALQWAPSYRRATLLQAPLALVSFLSGAGAWLLTGEVGWLVAAIMIGMVVPFTLVVIMPTNRQLLDPNRQLESQEIRDLLEKWNHLHTVRTILGLSSAILYVWLLHGA